MTMNTTEPAAGVWRDARTQEIGADEAHECLWLVMTIGTPLTGIATYDIEQNEFKFWENGKITGDVPMDMVIRYARINS